MSGGSISRGSLKLELCFAYFAAAAKVGAWVVVSALVFRRLGAADLGILALARSTVGLLAYAGAGLAPALVHRIAQAARGTTGPVPALPIEEGGASSAILSYESRVKEPFVKSHVAYSNGLIVAVILAVVAMCWAIAYGEWFTELHGQPADLSIGEGVLKWMVIQLAVGTLLRLVSDVPGAVLQTSGWLWIDYGIQAAGDVAWAGFSVFIAMGAKWDLGDIGYAFAVSGIIVLIGRLVFAGYRQQLLLPKFSLVSWGEAMALLGYGLAVVFALLADFLYAPTDYILINHFLGADQVAAYAPAVQFDSALALVVTVLAGVLLPRTALAHAAGDHRAVRRLYLRGTMVSVVLLIPIAILLWLGSPIIFRLWLGNDMPQTRAILPLVLFHTIVGGSSIVGRSVLLGIGRVRAYALAVAVAGVANVLLSWFFVAGLGMGLYGIVLGTIIVIAARCAIWMPWYVLKVIRAAPAGPVEPPGTVAAQEYAP